MVRDIAKGEAQAAAALDAIAHVGADAILLLDVDWDAGGAGLSALRSALAERGAPYPHGYAGMPNAGVPSGLDLDGDGTAHRARDALGYGRFTGDGGMALLSRWPVAVVAHDPLWADVSAEAAALLPEGGATVVPLATVAQWEVTLDAPGGPVTLITLAGGTPVFDGPEDRNGLRNRDELRFAAGLAAAAPHPVVALGRANVDPLDGEGRRDGLAALLAHPRLADPEPRGAGGGGEGHAGDPALDTAAWDGPGPLRVDYVLPDRAFEVVGSGVLWPIDGPLAETVAAAGSGRVVWVDLRRRP
ncbi:endonuclease/exonuclease/phosphatase family protein [Jannaschia sp. Os4]|uniref:endonuclease/exonuclease/phosphatase family protein n=1 Tax=Jannaschia sp. Os4 TaxID=2807617 RepID=UPI001EED8D17|nr:endonuclease/exonuclease/phosphatase family protein [Jannaschia sp. Os4]